MTEQIVYVAIVNVPGYLAELDPFYSHDAAECWTYLADEREAWECEYPEENDGEFSDTLSDLRRLARYARHGVNRCGLVYGDTPGYDGSHDLGLAYSVEPASDVRWDDESNTWVTIDIDGNPIPVLDM